MRACAASILAINVLAVAGCAHEPTRAAKETKPHARLVVHDDAHAFLDFWARARGESDAARVERYKRELAPRFPELWDYAVATWTGDVDERLAKELRAFESIEREFRAAADRLGPSLDSAIERLHGAFPDFDPSVDVRLVHSLGHMDGGTRVFRKRYYLLFGVELIAQLHRWEDDRPFFIHELFHAYQDQKNGRDGRSMGLVDSIEEEKNALARPLYASIWAEGLATYVSEWLTPGAPRANLLLDLPKGLEAACRANLSYLAQDLASRLESTSTEDYLAYLEMRATAPADPRRPWRAGYYLGYLVAKRLHAKLPMQKLVLLSGDELRDAMRAELVDMAKSSGSGER